MDEVVCAPNFFKRKGAKPILRVTYSFERGGLSVEVDRKPILEATILND